MYSFCVCHAIPYLVIFAEPPGHMRISGNIFKGMFVPRIN